MHARRALPTAARRRRLRRPAPSPPGLAAAAALGGCHGRRWGRHAHCAALQRRRQWRRQRRRRCCPRDGQPWQRTAPADWGHGDGSGAAAAAAAAASRLVWWVRRGCAGLLRVSALCAAQPAPPAAPPWPVPQGQQPAARLQQAGASHLRRAVAGAWMRAAAAAGSWDAAGGCRHWRLAARAGAGRGCWIWRSALGWAGCGRGGGWHCGGGGWGPPGVPRRWRQRRRWLWCG